MQEISFSRERPLRASRILSSLFKELFSKARNRAKRPLRASAPRPFLYEANSVRRRKKEEERSFVIVIKMHVFKLNQGFEWFYVRNMIDFII